MNREKSAGGTPGTETVTMVPDPALRRQLGEDGIVVFWRDGRAPGRREGLVCVLGVCPHPDCMCREVHLDAFATDDAAGLVEWSSEGVRIVGAAAGSAPDADELRSRTGLGLVDLESGEVRAHPDVPDSADPVVLAWVRSEVDGELLEHLHRFWMRAKGIPMGRPAKDIHLGEWHPGDLVGFDELFHDEREDQYVLGGRRYWAYTFHCPDRGCRCGEARVAFFDDEAELSVSVGSVVLHLGAGERRARVVEKAPEGGAPANLIGELWALFRRRHDVGAYLRRRDARVRSLDLDALRPPAAAPGRPAARPGRNDPCPCGSGRKFKKCCLGKDAEPGEPG